ncbi:hypothetical protein [Nocardia stercoris]|nr:hypothetical protein [Nocardia stercoris]
MTTDIAVLVVCAGVTVTVWALLVAWVVRRTRGARPRRRPAPVPTPATAAAAAAELDTQLTTEWASRNQVWPALNAENALLRERLAGKLSPLEYRARLADLARRCDPEDDPK